MSLINIRKNKRITDDWQTRKVRALAELLSRADCVKKFGSDYFTAQQISEGRLFRLEKGVFAERAHVPELALLSWKYPKAVITMLSAFYYYGLTDVVPDVCDLATDMNSAKIRDVRVHQYFLPGDFLCQFHERHTVLHNDFLLFLSRFVSRSSCVR